MKHAGLLSLLSVACIAQAQPVYKCTAADGSNSYQSTPCAEGLASATRAHASKAMGAAPTAAPSTGALQSASAVPGQRRTQVRYTTTAANAACDGARAQRTAALGAAGAEADAGLRADLDRAVQDACR